MNNETKDIDKPKFSGIYCIKNKVNNMVYIGLSKNIHNRWIEHKYRLNTHIHPNTKLQNAWDKYGEDNFEFIVLEKCDYDVIYEREKYWIKNINLLKENLDIIYQLVVKIHQREVFGAMK